ncbi:hypothetical protein A4R26_12120 [Niastella populi]|uniref:Uncharacterized protein n=1 Tax=Niastella populi TaxID=550983 RepID=A0A1V9GAT5_9BACT|nr:hypothetical protein A4R26_12120 [Niastella populi]
MRGGREVIDRASDGGAFTGPLAVQTGVNTADAEVGRSPGESPEAAHFNNRGGRLWKGTVPGAIKNPALRQGSYKKL